MTGAVFPELPVGFCDMHYAYVITRDEQRGRGARRKPSNFSLMEMKPVSFTYGRADTSPQSLKSTMPARYLSWDYL
jgi:hypothetical protein